MDSHGDRLFDGGQSSPVRWAVIGKHPGQRDEYTVLADDSGGPRRQEYAQTVRSMIPSNPSSARDDRIEALPWVYIAPLVTPAGHRMALAIMEWPSEEVRDATGRPAAQTRYFDVDLETAMRRETDYRSLLGSLADLHPPDGTPLVFTARPADPTAIAGFITEFGASTLVGAAALLLESPVVILSDASLRRLEDRLQCLDAVLALLPYGIRGSLTVSSWTLNDAPHALRLTFSDRMTAGQRGIRRGEPVLFQTRTAQDYAERVTRFLRNGDPHRIERLVERLWQDRRAYSTGRPEEVLNALVDLDQVYAVYQDLTRGVSSVGDVLALLRRADTDLTTAEPEVAERLVREVLDRAGPNDLEVLGRHWAASVVPRLVVGTALTASEPRTRGLWSAVCQAGAQASFLDSIIVAACNQEEYGRVARFLAGLSTAELPEPGVLRDALLDQHSVAIRLLLDAFVARRHETFGQWSGLLFGGDQHRPDELPVWAAPFAAMRAGRAELTKQQLSDRRLQGSRTLLALFAVASSAHGPEVFLDCANAWSALHNQLIRRDPDHIRVFLQLTESMIVRSPRAQAALDLLRVAAAVRLFRTPVVLELEEQTEYLAGVQDRFERLVPALSTKYGVAMARELTEIGMDSQAVAFLRRMARLLSVDGQTDVYRRIAERASIYPGALAGQDDAFVQYLVDLVPSLGHRLARIQLADAARSSASEKRMFGLCVDAHSRGMDVIQILNEIIRWPDLDDPAIAFHLIEEIWRNSPKPADPRAKSPVLGPGLGRLLSDHANPERARRFARWLAEHIEHQRRQNDFLAQVLKGHKPPKETREELRGRRSKANQPAPASPEGAS